MNSNESKQNLSQVERHSKIMELLKDQSNVSVNILSMEFHVSEVTIRKDLEELEKQSMLIRTHGGAIPIQQHLIEEPYNIQLMHNIEEKKRIGKVAAEMIPDNSVVFMECSTTVLQIARQIPHGKNITVITTSPHIVIELANKITGKIIVVPGEVKKETMGISGTMADKMLSEMSFDMSFVGVSAIDSELNMSTSFIEEASTKKAALAVSKNIIGVADTSKFGKKYFMSTGHITQLKTLIVNKELNQEYTDKIRKTGINVILA